jgi:precorrin-6A synthase
VNNIRLIGIGTGNPEHLTFEAKRFIESSDLVLLPNKGSEKKDLINLRKLILNDILKTKKKPALLEFLMPTRDDENNNYLNRVSDWHSNIALSWSEAIRKFKLDTNMRNINIALLIWGDPSLYDSSLRIFSSLNENGRNYSLTVIPGVTALQALTAAHKIPINSLAEPFLVTTGRMLRKSGWPNELGTIAVMLDQKCSFNRLNNKNLYIWWGAYLGMKAEMLMSGYVSVIGESIQKTRAEARDRHGWIMDTYILRKKKPS